jgi:phosphoribosylaminoimidazole-succinocarboxamide synthase
MGKEGQKVPEMSTDWVDTISKRYIELYEQVIGAPFTPEPLSHEETYDRIIENLQILKLA